jgi:hypothetical protein
MMVEVVIVDAVVVNVVGCGRTTVNAPDGDPDATFLVAVRTNVDVIVVIVTQSAGIIVPPATWIAAVGRLEGEIRQAQAELMKSWLYGASPVISIECMEIHAGHP